MTGTIPLVDLQAQYATIQDEIDQTIHRVIGKSQFIMGPDVPAFEADFAEYCRAAHCVGVASGTAALELTLRACEVGPGAEVITVAHTFIATAEAVSAVGAHPVFVDIDPHTYNLDPALLEQAITPRTRAIVPVHLYGQPADMPRIIEIARAHNLVVIEDAAQAHGAEWNGRRVGTLADAACFSFYPGKNLGAYGDAGAVTTDRPDIAERVRLLRNHGRRDKYVHEVKGYGERIDTLQAAILRVKLAHLDAWTTARRRLAARYDILLADCGLMLPHVADVANPVWHLYVVCSEARDSLLAALNRQHIGTGVHYPVPLHLQPAYADLGYVPGDLPVTERVADECLSLPLFPEMTEAQQDRVVATLLESVAQAQPD